MRFFAFADTREEVVVPITKTVNVLVFPCGSEIALEIHKALSPIRFIHLIGASGGDDHGRFVFDDYIGDVPFFNDPACIVALNEIISEREIDFIFPAHDGVLFELSQARDQLNAPLLTSSLETVRICRYKHETYAALSEFDFIPRTYESADTVDAYPVIVKPSAGSASVGVELVSSKEELVSILAQAKGEQVIVEYLEDDEYTVDCFTDRKGTLQLSSGRVRTRIRAGISVRSSVAPNQDVFAGIAQAVSETLNMRGAWFFQVKQDAHGAYKLLEVASRVAGTMCVSRARGVNIALMAVLDAMGETVRASAQFDDVCVDRAFDNKFKVNFAIDHLYMDFDDTLIVHNSVNMQALSLVYRCVESGVPVTLITRHAADISESLASHRLCKTLFDDIVVLDRETPKTSAMAYSPGALLVDDSFGERQAVVTELGIKAIGPDAIEAFL